MQKQPTKIESAFIMCQSSIVATVFWLTVPSFWFPGTCIVWEKLLPDLFLWHWIRNCQPWYYWSYSWVKNSHLYKHSWPSVTVKREKSYKVQTPNWTHTHIFCTSRQPSKQKCYEETAYMPMKNRLIGEVGRGSNHPPGFNSYYGLPQPNGMSLKGTRQSANPTQL